MLELQSAILAALLQLPCPMDEPRAECAPWREQVAAVIAQAAEEATCTSPWSGVECVPLWPGPADELAALLIEVADHESGLRKRIQAGQCRDDECDSTWRWKHGKRKHTGHLANSMWQLHESPYIPGIEMPLPHERWLASTGTDPANVLTAAHAAAWLIAHNPKAFGLTLGSKGPRGQAMWRILSWIRAHAIAGDD